MSIKLGSQWVSSKSGSNAGKLILKDEKFFYVPILQTLQQLLGNPSIRTEVYNVTIINLHYVHVHHMSVVYVHVCYS